MTAQAAKKCQLWKNARGTKVRPPYWLLHEGFVKDDSIDHHMVIVFLELGLLDLQGDQLNMAVFSVTLYLMALLVYATMHANADKSLFPSYQKKTAMFNWSPFILENRSIEPYSVTSPPFYLKQLFNPCCCCIYRVVLATRIQKKNLIQILKRAKHQLKSS